MRSSSPSPTEECALCSLNPSVPRPTVFAAEAAKAPTLHQPWPRAREAGPFAVIGPGGACGTPPPPFHTRPLPVCSVGGRGSQCPLNLRGPNAITELAPCGCCPAMPQPEPCKLNSKLQFVSGGRRGLIDTVKNAPPPPPPTPQSAKLGDPEWQQCAHEPKHRHTGSTPAILDGILEGPFRHPLGYVDA